MTPTDDAEPTHDKSSAVVLVIDQLTATMLGPYGNTLYDTPNFNRLAGQSLLYDFAYADSTDLSIAYDRFWNPGNDQPLPVRLAGDGIETILVTDEAQLCDHASAQFDRILSLTPPPANVAATSATETQLASFFAQATTMLSDSQTQLESGSLFWLHSKGLGGAWDAPYQERVRLADPDDPAPPTFVQSPQTWLDPESVDPDELLGLQQCASAQIVLLDQFLGVLLDMFESHPALQTSLFCLTSLRGCGLGEHGLVGIGDQLFDESIHIPLLVRTSKQTKMSATRSAKFALASSIGNVVEDWFAAPSIDSFETKLLGQATVLPVQHEHDTPQKEFIVTVSREQESIQTYSWKLIRSKMGGAKLFAKPDDRCDVNDVSDRCQAEVRDLLSLLDEELGRG